MAKVTIISRKKKQGSDWQEALEGFLFFKRAQGCKQYHFE